jgi:oligopeptide/dipeptide ABC transporter ATP-binding protein
VATVTEVTVNGHAARPVLSIADLAVTYANGARAVRGLTLAIHDDECLALVGESGCGKTTVALAVLGMLPRRARVDGSVRVRDTEILGAPERTLRALRGRDVGYVAQDPFAACDPLRSVAHHVSEAWVAKGERPPRGAVAARLEALGIDHAARRAKGRPHQWSGGMLQRATIAAANVHRPALTVADEPTSALDADRSDGVLVALREASKALLLVSHDLGLVARHADRVAVMYHGRIVETGPTSEVMEAARHPYTQALIAASPRRGEGMPKELPGAPPSLLLDAAGCSMAPRCRLASAICTESRPELLDGVACHHTERPEGS